MIEQEKVAEALGNALLELRWARVTGYKIEAEKQFGIEDSIENALGLLKAQEPVEPTAKSGAYFCGNPSCRKIITQMVPCGAPTHKAKYCSECGRKVKWK